MSTIEQVVIVEEETHKAVKIMEDDKNCIVVELVRILSYFQGEMMVQEDPIELEKMMT